MFCGGLLPYPSGTIRSPGFPLPYFSGLRCLWFLTTLSTRKRIFMLDYKRFDVEECCDSLKIFTRNNVSVSGWDLEMLRTGRCIDGEALCPCEDSKSVQADRVYLTFTSDSEGETAGFEIFYSSIGKWSSLIVGGNLHIC